MKEFIVIFISSQILGRNNLIPNGKSDMWKGIMNKEIDNICVNLNKHNTKQLQWYYACKKKKEKTKISNQKNIYVGMVWKELKYLEAFVLFKKKRC